MLKSFQALLLFVPLSLCACGGDAADAGSGPSGGGSGGGSAPLPVTTDRFQGAGAEELRRALDLGLHGKVVELLEQVDPADYGVEHDLLLARLASLEGRDVDVTPLIEKARTAAPEDPRVYATAAELHAASGRLETASVEINRGLETCGPRPELLRAQGVLMVCKQGRAQEGVELFERALSYDRSLPFTVRPRAQAKLLLAKMALSEQRPQAALALTKESLSLDSLDIDARIFFADVLASNGEYPSAVQVLEELQIEGVDRKSELALMYKRAAIGEMVLGNKEASLEYFRLARGAGLSDEELGSGADQLAAAAKTAMAGGVEAFQAGNLDLARIQFEEALNYDPSLLVVKTQLAVVLFQQEKYLPAATQYREVLDVAIAEGLELPDPVHIFLAKALHKAGDENAAKKVLEAYLTREPEGQWASATRSLVGELE